ncbi:Alpha/Beta hydrolase protein [Globomyces pollinis-pini]|nr:Alpha/Beta hydrolase protein [Globomyces pollinis-pini]
MILKLMYLQHPKLYPFKFHHPLLLSSFSMPLYPELEPYNTFFHKVSEIHSLYVEESGNPNGKPVVFLHGGPGGGTSGLDRRYFNPDLYRIVLFDQRGAGLSTPTACLEENDTWSLVSDIESIRKRLNIDKWIVFGGSWGSTLSLAYAQTHPSVVKGLILRGIFMLRPSELKWFYQEGAHNIFPDYWDGYLAPIPVEERGDLIAAYHKRLTSSDPAIQLEAAKAWSTWECATSKLNPNEEMISKASEDKWSLAFARIECHYFFNKGFFSSDSFLLENMHKIRHIPGVIVQGRYDVVCPAISAWDVKKEWPEATLHITPNSGHSATEKETTELLVAAADKFSTL